MLAGLEWEYHHTNWLLTHPSFNAKYHQMMLSVQATNGENWGR